MTPRPLTSPSMAAARRQSSRRGFTLLLVMFVLTLIGVTLLTVGRHFSQTSRYAQSARMEAQAAQILHSGLSWMRLHPPAPADAAQRPILLDVNPLVGPGAEASLALAWDAERDAWQLTARLVRGRQTLTRSTYFHAAMPESKSPDSR